MCLNKEILLNLCELYPATGEHIRQVAAAKRKNYINYWRKASKEDKHLKSGSIVSKRATLSNKTNIEYMKLKAENE